jgi:HEAT repeat protein
VLLGLPTWLILLRPLGPHYQGRSLSRWLNDVGPGSGFYTGGARLSPSRRDAAIDAVRRMGPAAYPFLLQMLKAQDGRVKKAILEKLGRQRSLKFGLLSADEKRFRAKIILSELGFDAAVAWRMVLLDPTFDPELRLDALRYCETPPKDAPKVIPLLLQFMAEAKPEQRYTITRTVRRFGPDAALPVLVGQLRDPDRTVQLMAMRALKSFEDQAIPAIPALEQQLKSNDKEVALAAADALMLIDSHNLPASVCRMDHPELVIRTAAYWMLAQMEQLPPTMIPCFMRGLAEPDPGIREAAAQALGKYGTNAQAALPALTNLLKVSSDSRLYQVVTNAISRIVASK